MLQQLTVENYTLISRLSIELKNGFTVITGETGAGKSIIIGALSLLLGQRADSGALLDPEKKCVIEGVFYGKDYNLEAFFASNDLDFDPYVIIRREITSSGKSRAFINDTPVTLSVLKELGESLVDIHSQHAILTLNDSSFQLNMVDEYAGNHNLLKNYRSLFQLVQEMKSKLRDLKEEELRAGKETDYMQFLFNELSEAHLIAGEKESLEEELKVLENAEEIKAHLFEIRNILSAGESNVLSGLSGIVGLLKKISAYHHDASQLYNRCEVAYIDLKDIDNETGKIEEMLVFDPERIQHVNDRLSLIYRLEQKHQVQDVEALLKIKDELEGKLQQIDNLDERIAVLQKQVQIKEAEQQNECRKLGETRQKVLKPVSEQLTNMVKQLGMPDAQVRLVHNALEKPGPDGSDGITLLFNANKGGQLREVASIASGGELSRLMLSVKYMLSMKKKLPTLVFDEIDVGISGEIAAKMGNMMLAMSGHMQLITITHLPQIAGKAANHILVYKESSGDTTRSGIRVLNHDERVVEIAKMLSDEHVSEISLLKAKELLKPDHV